MVGVRRDRVAVIDPNAVFREAKAVPGMVPFFTLLGSRITHHDDTPKALEALLNAGLGADRAWQIIDGWEGCVRRESATGWAAEVVAMAVFMNDVPDFAQRNWLELAHELAKGPD